MAPKSLEIVVRDNSEAIVDITGLNTNAVHWLRGNPNNPERNLLIFYQKYKNELNVDYDFLNNLYQTIGFEVNPVSGEVNSSRLSSGGIPLDKIPVMDNWERSMAVDRLNYFRNISTDQEGILHLDVVFVPYGVDRDLAKNEILRNYVLKHLANADYSVRLNEKRM